MRIEDEVSRLWEPMLNINIGFLTIPGWSNLLGVEDMVHDSTVAILAALLLFSIPVDIKKKEFVLDWHWAKDISWGILILFGGGIALAKGVQSTGLANWIGDGISVVSNFPVILIILSVCLLMTFMTEITSNTAVSTIFMPILAATAVAAAINPLLLMAPAAISASCAFMLPVAFLLIVLSLVASLFRNLNKLGLPLPGAEKI
ncbi:MAG: anion permease [Candidatus Marinimicrobia bacterium]|nr:anion permease [Candidatus Neomarinimicrobiota bacterium]